MSPRDNQNANSISSTQGSPSVPNDAIAVDDKLYSMKMLASNHPGGELFVKAFAGRDATEAFWSYHRRAFPHESVKHALLGQVQQTVVSSPEYLELCALVDQVLPKHKSFAPWYYFVKIGVLLTVTFSLEFYLHLSGNYKWYYTMFLGWCFALIGLNIQHDANHGSISRNAKVNRILGMTQNWIGGSAVDWIHQHVVQHHIYCNDLHEDPDIMGNIAMRLNPLKPLLSFHAFQYLYVFLMIGLFGFSVVFTSLMHVLTERNFAPMSVQLRSHKSFEILMSTLFIMRWTVIPCISTVAHGGSVLSTFLNIAPMFVTGGYYLAIFFLISHNFVGVHMYDGDNGEKKSAVDRNDFLYRQVVTSSNVGGPFLCFLNGGLNYQIEHHLFPRVQHSHYPTIAPIVKAFCEKKGIPYIHFPTISENILSCAQHLFNMGHMAKNTRVVLHHN